MKPNTLPKMIKIAEHSDVRICRPPNSGKARTRVFIARSDTRSSQLSRTQLEFGHLEAFADHFS